MIRMNVKAESAAVAGSIKDGLETGLERAVRIGFEVSQREVPVDSGRLKESGEVVHDRADGSITFGYAAPYAEHVEGGTAAHPIEPDNADVLAFEVDGETVYAMSVDHPGTDAQPFMQPGFEAMAREIRQRGLGPDIDAELKR